MVDYLVVLYSFRVFRPPFVPPAFLTHDLHHFYRQPILQTNNPAPSQYELAARFYARLVHPGSANANSFEEVALRFVEAGPEGGEAGLRVFLLERCVVHGRVSGGSRHVGSLIHTRLRTLRSVAGLRSWGAAVEEVERRAAAARSATTAAAVTAGRASRRSA